ncbi:MAG: hypothetical protein LBV38_03715 [Alistipes sp.]|jgi:hypothetical protein|nr:hypothetical protein [Alistipes sp.]
MKKITNIILIALVLLAVLSVATWLFGGNELAEVDFMIYVTYAYLGLAVLSLVGLTLMNMGKSRSNSKVGLFVFGGLAVLAVILWAAFAKAIPVTGADGTVFDDVFTLKITDTGLYLTYAALALTVLFLFWGVIRKALK